MDFLTIASVGGSLVAVSILILLVRYATTVWRGDYRHAPGSKSVWWIPGHGTHGGGGQVPPIIPEDDD